MNVTIRYTGKINPMHLMEAQRPLSNVIIVTMTASLYAGDMCYYVSFHASNERVHQSFMQKLKAGGSEFEYEGFESNQHVYKAL